MTLDLIAVDGIKTTCIIGILPAEREQEQDLLLSLELELDLALAATSGDLVHTLDYARIAHEAGFILKAGRFHLLETAALVLCHYLLTPPPGQDVTVVSASVGLTKPAALGGNGLPTVRLRRRIEQVGVTKEALPYGDLWRIFEARDVALLRLHGWPAAMPIPESFRYSRTTDLALPNDATLRIMT